MFGAIIFIPLFLQLVYGVSPTSSGLRMLPLMARPARRRASSPAARSAASAATRRSRSPAPRSRRVGLFLLSRLEVDTPPWVASVYMLVVGVGIGLVMQVLVLVVQNDAPPRDIGVATSTATFFRSMGGSLGVALFGAIFASRLTDELADAARGAARLSRRRQHPPGPGPRAARRRAPRLPARLRRRAAAGVPRRRGAHRRRLRARRCLLKEVPLRATTHEASDLAVEEAAAAATGAEAIIAPDPSPPVRAGRSKTTERAS